MEFSQDVIHEMNAYVADNNLQDFISVNPDVVTMLPEQQAPVKRCQSILKRYPMTNKKPTKTATIVCAVGMTSFAKRARACVAFDEK